ncbi:MAG: hypothetical protein MUF52_06140 [Syntrophobacteraceae bacterium]|jgi:hypothetical protein|nr:hypothetical protein [Syntrophobacteraceae bacterium]
MSIRLIAIELYKAKQEVEALERKIRGLPPGDQAGRAALQEELRQATAEHARILKLLDGAKSG